MDALRRAGLSTAALEKLADADAFGSMGLDRRQALWQVSIKNPSVALYQGQEVESGEEKKVKLPLMSEPEQVVRDYATLSLSVRAHPVSFVREKLEQLQVMPAAALQMAVDGQVLKVAGLVLVRQRPGTAGGVCFMTIEDETGVANLVIFENLFEKYRREILQSKLIMVEGKLQREGDVIHVIAQKCHNISALLRRLVPSTEAEEPSLLTLSRADERSIPADPINPRSRNFR
jgi:error-prone DNA polymerase